MPPTNQPAKPQKPGQPPLDAAWVAANPTLYQNVREALAAVPAYFRTETYISGIMAPDLFTLNTVLGAAIEEQTVATLNAMRQVWDQAGAYALYSFVRQAQTFPDVLLRRASDGHILLGIELKGWYLLAKEGEPSLRFVATPLACNPQDLIAVVPWALSNVISGSPVVFTPYVESARYAALHRNYWWEHERKVSGTSARGVQLSAHVTAYPKKSDPISDQALSDSGGNFGRLARTTLMDSYVQVMLDHPLCGVRAKHWLKFLQAIQERHTEARIRQEITALTNELAASASGADETGPVMLILEQLRRLSGLADE